MDLSNPLATVSPTLDAAVLQVLASTTGMSTAGHVQRMLEGAGGKGSVDGVRRVLTRLVGQGIVLSEVHTHATLYWLNREHLAVESILELTRLRLQIIKRIVEDIESWPFQPLNASLFGSFARGSADESSDVDVLLVTNIQVFSTSEPAWQNQVGGLAGRIRRWTGNLAQIVEVDTWQLSGMIETGDQLVDSWRADHVHLAGEPLLELLRTRPVSPLGGES